MYKWVVDDVTKTVREEFLNEGVDSQVLEDLKQVSGFEDDESDGNSECTCIGIRPDQSLFWGCFHALKHLHV